MSRISNRFFITAIEDGTTLHGVLSNNKPISQAWTGVGCRPNWTQSDEQPTIYLVLMSGNSYVNPSSITNQKWYYNHVEMLFSNNVSTYPAGADGKFQKTTFSFDKGGGEYINVPALKIIGNLASSNNLDVDTISFSGNCAVGGNATIPFNVATQVRITAITGNSYLGVAEYVGGVANFTSKGQNVSLYGILYSGETGDEANNYTVTFYVNGTEFSTEDYPNSSVSTVLIDGTSRSVLTLNEADVVDNAVIGIKFMQSGNVLAYAFANVDDMTDPEYLYIQYMTSGVAGTSTNAVLRNGDTVTFSMFVGNSSTAVHDITYNHFEVMLMDAFGEVITEDITGIPDADENGWRNVTVEGTGQITLSYNTVVTYFSKSLTGIVKAEQGEL